LNYAEARAVLGTITQNDLDISVNKLRDRVGMPRLVIGNITTDPDWNFPKLNPLMNEIRRERRVELAMEGFRLDDIMRWAAGGILLTGYIPLGTKFHQNKYPNVTVGKDVFLNENDYIEPYKKKFPDGYKFDTGRD